MDRPPFVPFGPAHLGALGSLTLAGAAVVAIGRCAGPRLRRGLAWALALLPVTYAATAYTALGLAGALAWEYSLPLELCHWVLIAGVVALLRRQALAAEITYFWGLGGTLHALVTPDLAAGFPSWDFVAFFWGHGAVLLAIAFLVGADGFRPRPGSPLRMLAAVNVYAVVVGALDATFGWNYGYLCRKPARASLLDPLGPWPWYLAALEAVALVTFLALDLPWRRLRRAPSAGSTP